MILKCHCRWPKTTINVCQCLQQLPRDRSHSLQPNISKGLWFLSCCWFKIIHMWLVRCMQLAEECHKTVWFCNNDYLWALFLHWASCCLAWSLTLLWCMKDAHVHFWMTLHIKESMCWFVWTFFEAQFISLIQICGQGATKCSLLKWIAASKTHLQMSWFLWNTDKLLHSKLKSSLQSQHDQLVWQICPMQKDVAP